MANLIVIEKVIIIKYCCEICGKPMELKSWLVSRKCISCLEEKLIRLEEIKKMREEEKNVERYEEEIE